MEKIIIKEDKIELRTELGTVRGRYYYRNNELQLASKKAYDLATLVKYKEEIKKAI